MAGKDDVYLNGAIVAYAATSMRRMVARALSDGSSLGLRRFIGPSLMNLALI